MITAGKFRLNCCCLFFIDLSLLLLHYYFFFYLCVFYSSPAFYTFLHPPANPTHLPLLPHHHQGVRSPPVPALQPVRHTLVTANPSFHSSTHFLSSPFLRKYIFFSPPLFFFVKGEPERHAHTDSHTDTHPDTHAHTPLQGLSYYIYIGAV